MEYLDLRETGRFERQMKGAHQLQAEPVASGFARAIETPLSVVRRVAKRIWGAQSLVNSDLRGLVGIYPRPPRG
jgi:hypothetical protein